MLKLKGYITTTLLLKTTEIIETEKDLPETEKK